MDGEETPYREKFEKLAKCKGEIVALVSNNLGETFARTEKGLLKSYEIDIAHNAALPDDLQETDLAEVDQQARAAIQAYKIKHGIPLDTPPVSETPPPRYDNAANDPVYEPEP